jgi:hypothetical protein
MCFFTEDKHTVSAWQPELKKNKAPAHIYSRAGEHEKFALTGI